MRRNLFSVFFLFTLLTACLEDLYLQESRLCGQACALDGEGYLRLGDEALKYTCNVGVLECSDYGETCVGSSPKGDEVCNGIDDDCDGRIDELSPKAELDADNNCKDLAGICSFSKEVCFQGEWICDFPDEYGVEVCDGIDNDCDGSIDEEQMILSGPQFGYDGPLHTMNVGACRGYIRRCVGGYEKKDGQVLPRQEICGNGVDDDCDGLTDENEGDSVTAAIALLIDASGSMGNTTNVVKEAICEWAIEPVFAESKFSVFLVGTADSFYVKVSDFDTAAAVCASLNSLAEYQAGGYEFFPDLILDLHDETSDNYLSWPEGYDHMIIVFSDEPPHTDFDANLDHLLNLITEQCDSDALNYTVSVFSTTEYKPHWMEITESCDGWFEYLSNDKEQMLEKLSARAKGKC